MFQNAMYSNALVSFMQKYARGHMAMHDDLPERTGHMSHKREKWQCKTISQIGRSICHTKRRRGNAKPSPKKDRAYVTQKDGHVEKDRVYVTQDVEVAVHAASHEHHLHKRTELMSHKKENKGQSGSTISQIDHELKKQVVVYALSLKVDRVCVHDTNRKTDIAYIFS